MNVWVRRLLVATTQHAVDIAVNWILSHEFWIPIGVHGFTFVNDERTRGGAIFLRGLQIIEPGGRSPVFT